MLCICSGFSDQQNSSLDIYTTCEWAMETFVPAHAPVNLFLWSNPSWRLSPWHPCTPHWWDGGEDQKSKSEKTHRWHKGNLIVTAKAVHASQAKSFLHSPLPSAESPGKQNSITSKLLEKVNAIAVNILPFPPSPPSFIAWAWCHMVWDIPLFCWYIDDWILTIPSVCLVHPWAYSLVEYETESAFIVCEHCSAGRKTFLPYQPCFQHRSKIQPHASQCDKN